MGQRRKRLFNHDLVIRLHFLLLLHLATVAIYVYTICVDNRITFYTHLQHNEKYNFQHVWAAACKCHVNMVYCIDMTFQMDSTLNHLDLFWSPKILDTFAFGSILCSQAISHYFFFLVSVEITLLLIMLKVETYLILSVLLLFDIGYNLLLVHF